jgi:hypothetical protein
MKQLVTLAVLAFGLFSCSSPEDKTSAESLAVVKRYIDAVESNNAAAMDSLLADNYMGYGPSIADSTNKADALRNWKYNSENLYESIKYTRHHNIAVTVKEGQDVEAGNWVSNWAYLTIKFKNAGPTVNVWANTAYLIENGKIIRSRTFYNEADVLRQLGYVSVPKDEAP